jgi:hypothetical protein
MSKSVDTNHAYDVTFSVRVVVGPNEGTDEAIDAAIELAVSYGLPALYPQAVFTDDTDDDTTWPTGSEEI